MKKIITLAMFVALCTFSNAQNYEVIDITSQFEFGVFYQYCATIDSIVINQDETCQNQATWLVSNNYNGSIIFEGSDNHCTITPNMGEQIGIYYTDCHVTHECITIEFTDFETVPEPWTEDVHWLNHGETIHLEAPYLQTLNYLWTDGSTGTWYNVTSPEWSGKIWVRMYNDCGELSDTINVYYNGDLMMATVDPQTDHIIVTWEVNPLLASYLENLTIIRDGYQIATVPYIQGQYIDEAVSGSATSRTYRCKATAKNGSVCNVNSAGKPSIHMVYNIGYFGTVEMQWNNVKSNYDELFQYYISQLLNDGSIIHLDSLMPDRLMSVETVKTAIGIATMQRDGVINYSAPQSYFTGNGYLIVEADLRSRNNKQISDKFLSNRSSETVGLNEVENALFNIYPNPAKDRFTIEGIGTMVVTNMLGQTVMVKEIDGKETMELPRGLYFVKLGGATRKIVVE